MKTSSNQLLMFLLLNACTKIQFGSSLNQNVFYKKKNSEANVLLKARTLKIELAMKYLYLFHLAKIRYEGGYMCITTLQAYLTGIFVVHVIQAIPGVQLVTSVALSI